MLGASGQAEPELAAGVLPGGLAQRAGGRLGLDLRAEAGAGSGRDLGVTRGWLLMFI